ncbi:hypothetical protein BJ742DRAFT_848181 [Cladochytrium replicatum]|nr:hypothetical protein BJ742DRAFT_848181 [Cladochytrium replicatum]
MAAEAEKSLVFSDFQGAYTWSQILEIIEHNEYDRFSRFPETLEIYKAFREKTLASYATIADFVRINTLKFPSTIDSNGFLVSENPKDWSWWKGRTFAHPNDFPYATAGGIVHWVVWSVDPLTLEDTEKVLRNELGSDYDIVVFENPVYRKTIPDVSHTHGFVRKKPELI